ncbi:MAG: exodeoxyribonuclease VII large subunit [Deltaproteobacteria bacterium]|nr:exodeoxyribonuclease VII large subunit [Deltaproteobacteria bacterium]MBW2048430.1 exodeoxyribonuclease VII large subunit [Deltaproteobacteria bacterium]MBW2110400.1 exodeoxyribonuclease VII large subunit [Deltaproteobacteria bacterium]MBW2351989.1 exodeoxyribonuclease VII large subunit [Deltaproteobacteria bacterium]HDZ90968.1 exodeoxyribonuclease VII large subunit [Deltaproteobacteria bacterium]
MSDEMKTPKVYTVSDLTALIQDLLEDRFDFVWVEGEISNFRSPGSGHYYMVIKDEKAQIRAVMFRVQTRYLKFLPEDGMKVIAQGRIGIYAPRGEYQIILDYLEPVGTGALALAFEQVKKRLAAMGVFDEDIKKPLPFLPKRVAVITSPTGAAIRDFLKIIQRRYANLEILIVPVRVQGDRACRDMVEALHMVNRHLDADVIVLTRGGGSLEDLWAFNQEELALAIRDSRIPVVSAVGHEIDLTISDLAADFRAPTPSAAAELLVKEKETLLNRLKQARTRLRGAMDLRLEVLTDRLKGLRDRIRDPRKGLANLWMRLDEDQMRLVRVMDILIRERRKGLEGEIRALLVYSPINRITALRQALAFKRAALVSSMERQLREGRMGLALLHKRLNDLSPLSVLKRGYSITLRLPEKQVLKGVLGVERGDQVQVLLGEGGLKCRVEKVIG